MAGYAGARPRSTVFPRRGASLPSLWPRDPGAASPARRRVRSGATTRAHRRTSRTGTLAMALVVTFALGFVSLMQTVSASANGVQVDRLLVERQIMLDEQQQIRSDLYRLGREPAVRRQALDAGLGQLVDPLVVPAR